MRGFLLAFLSLACSGGTDAAWAQAGAPPPSSTASPGPVVDCFIGPYIVFFASDKAGIDAQARTILDTAIAALQCLHAGSVTVTGHADRSGPAARNLYLSRRRASAVAAYLARHGVELGTIAVQAFGESRSLVKTEDRLHEPQNRRVELLFGE